MLAQVERIEGIALHGEALGEMALEEVIDEAVHEKDRAARRLAAVRQAD
jgi:hypothetical protein